MSSPAPRQLTEHFTAEVASIAPARDAVDELALPSALADAARLVVGELAANAVLHAGPDEFTLVLEVRSPAELLVEVIDDGPGYDLNAQLHRPARVTSGRGLRIVAALSRDLTCVRERGHTRTRCIVEAVRI